MRVEVDVGPSAVWTEGPELDAVLAPLAAAATCKLPTELLLNEEHGISARCRTAFAAVQVLASLKPTIIRVKHNPTFTRSCWSLFPFYQRGNEERGLRGSIWPLQGNMHGGICPLDVRSPGAYKGPMLF